jgi:ketosteroid isomerase-like protein
MSQENVEAHRAALEAFNRRHLSAFLALMDPEVEAVSQLAAIEGSYHGHAGIRRWWENVSEALPDWTAEAVEVRAHGEFTIAALHSHGHGAGSGIPITQDIWNVARWRDGKALWWATYQSEAEALEAVGLREEDLKPAE